MCIRDSDQTLASCYRKVLELADAYHCESIALPLFDLKWNGWTKELSLQVALQEIRTFLFDHEMQVYLVVLISSQSIEHDKYKKSCSLIGGFSYGKKVNIFSRI